MIRWSPGGEQGLASVQTLVGLSLAVIVLLLAANLVVIQYTRAALTAAAAAGVRTGSLVGGSAESCERRAAAVLFGENGLLHGPYGSDARVRCTHRGKTMQAVGTATAVWWLEELPPVRLRVAAEAAVETRKGPALPPRSGSSR